MQQLINFSDLPRVNPALAKINPYLAFMGVDANRRFVLLKSRGLYLLCHYLVMKKNITDCYKIIHLYDSYLLPAIETAIFILLRKRLYNHLELTNSADLYQSLEVFKDAK